MLVSRSGGELLLTCVCGLHLVIFLSQRLFVSVCIQDKTKRELKVARLIEYSNMHKEITLCQQKMVSAMDHLNDLLMNDINEHGT